jgi:hypothetical protein
MKLVPKRDGPPGYGGSMTGGTRDDADKAIQLKRLKWFGHVVGAVVIIGCLTGVLVAVARAQYPLALLFVGATAFWSIPYGQKLFARMVKPRAMLAGGATTLRPGRSVDLSAAAMMLIGLSTGAAWVVLGLAGTVTFPFGAHYPLGYVIFFGALALFCAAYLATMLRHRGTAYLRFTPEDFGFAEGFFTGRGAWGDIAAVNDDTPVYSLPALKTTRAQPYAACAVSITKHDGTMVAVPDGNLYAPDGDALREWIRYYWEHPEHRAELTDNRALQRLRSWAPAV